MGPGPKTVSFYCFRNDVWEWLGRESIFDFGKEGGVREASLQILMCHTSGLLGNRAGQGSRGLLLVSPAAAKQWLVVCPQGLDTTLPTLLLSPSQFSPPRASISPYRRRADGTREKGTYRPCCVSQQGILASV